MLRRFVHTNKGFHQSYLFCGGWGSGKTTLARILARALLCESPQDGNPCDTCSSCLSILNHGSSDCFVEVDAASNSGKESMSKIIDLLQYDTFSGRRRIYLFDEAHRLSKDALDALLKPMEDTAPGSDDKQLVCIFCTTEPEKMRATIFSRCAPAFVIRTVPPEVIADRLAWVCQQENITYERDALVCISEAVESHIRDALKSVEGVSMMRQFIEGAPIEEGTTMLGPITMESVKSYLRLNANATYLKILLFLGKDMASALASVRSLQETVSPATIYEQLAELAMLAYRTGLNVGKPPSYWNPKHIQALYNYHKEFLIQIAKTLSMKPGHPTYSMLECDLSQLHYLKMADIVPTQPPVQVVQVEKSIVQIPGKPQQIDTVVSIPIESKHNSPDAGILAETPSSTPSRPVVTRSGVYVDPRGVRKKDSLDTHTFEIPPLEVTEFRRGLRRLVAELTADGRSRSTG